MGDEDVLERSGFTPVDDERIGQGYETCPLHHKSLIKNAVSFAYALAPKDDEPVERLRQISHLREYTQVTRCAWALFVFDERRFPVPALLSAVVPALVAKVETIIVASVTPCSPALFFGLDLLAVDQVYETHDPAALADCLRSQGPGVILDFAEQPLPADHHGQSFSPHCYRCTAHTTSSVELRRAYEELFGCVHVAADQPVYLAYADEAFAPAPRYVLSGQLLGCWVWDTITPDTFRVTFARFSYATAVAEQPL